MVWIWGEGNVRIGMARWDVMKGERRGELEFYLDYFVAHLAQFVEALSVRANEEDDDAVFFLRGAELRWDFRACSCSASSFLFLAALLEDVEEADVHIQVPVLVETRQAHRDPVLALAGLDPAGLEQHVKDELQVARVQRVRARPDHADQAPACDYEAVEQVLALVIEERAVDGLAVSVLELETLERGE